MENKQTLEEVREYFKNVAEIKGHLSNDNIKIDTEKFGVITDYDSFRQGEDDKKTFILLYEPVLGYAKITKYKSDIEPIDTDIETPTKGKHTAKLIWNNVPHTEMIHFDYIDDKSGVLITFYIGDGIKVCHVRTDIVTVIFNN
jgi:hypothetical protein